MCLGRGYKFVAKIKSQLAEIVELEGLQNKVLRGTAKPFVLIQIKATAQPKRP